MGKRGKKGKKGKRSKRGQVTLFVIIVIIIIVVGLVSYFIYQDYQKARQGKNTYIESRIKEIKTYIDSCAKISSEKITLETGKYSGYYEPASLSTDEGIAYYFDEEKNLMPTLEFIKNEINKGFNKELKKCVNFSIFEDKVQIKALEPQTSVDITKNNIEFDIKHLFTASKDGVDLTVEYSKRQIVGVRLKSIYELATAIVNEQIESKEYVYLTRFQELPKPTGINVTRTSERGISVFNITDVNALINNETYSFLFAGKI